MSYGEGLFHISEVDIWKNKLRIKVVDLLMEKEQWIFMSLKEAQSLVNDLGITLEEIAQANVDKLASRMERGKLGDSGDER